MRPYPLLLCLFASPALAQDQLIPKELVDGLLASRGMRQAVTYVGEIPREMAGKIYVPTGSRVVGGVSYGSGGTLILLSSQRRETIIAELERELPKAGWKQFDPTARMVNPYSEFREAPIPPGAVRIATTGPQTFCGPSGGMTVNVEQAGFADTRITITATDVNMCPTATTPAAQIDPRFAAEYAGRPTFVNPPGARGDYMVCNSGRDNLNWSSGGGTQLNSSMTPQALLDHYSKQMADSGWTLVESVRVTRTWTRTDTAGKKSAYQMSIDAPSPNLPCRKVETQFMRSR